ncbi:MAG TPA: YdcH family protein, partial [Bryobacteraceae bacterium]
NLSGGFASMEHNAQEELKAHLMESNEEFRRLAQQHSELKSKLDGLRSLPHLTYEEQMEETRMKKLKLHLKDQMEAIMSQYRAQRVA